MKRTLLALPILAACATQTYWQHPTKPAEQFYADNVECLALARNTVPEPVAAPQTNVVVGAQPPSVAAAIERGQRAAREDAEQYARTRDRRTIHEHCLYARGWQRVTR